MDFNQYQEESFKTAFFAGKNNPFSEDVKENISGLIYCTLGLTEEAGEVSGNVKKLWRDDDLQMTPERKDKLEKELGDTLWYLSAMAKMLGMSLEDVAQANIDKCIDRKNRDVQHGDGDDR
jgi:NTP pyrophosphatase (non-canonical NTP hydrolase)